MACEVVNVRRDVYDVYIGRTCNGLEGSKFANPYVADKGETSEKVIERYSEWLWSQIYTGRITVEELAALDGQRLGCWCKPKPCHGDILAKAVAWAVKEVAKNTCVTPQSVV